MKLNKLYIFLLSFVLLPTLRAQDNILYQFSELAQSIKLNPANKPDCKVFIGIPVLSNFKLSYNNSAFAYKDLFSKNGTDSLKFNLEGLQQQNSLNNHIRLGLETDILSVGLAYKDLYFMFNVANTTQANISFPKSIFDLTKGNWNTTGKAPINYDFNTLGFYAQSYNNFSLSASKQINRKLRIGTRFSYLKGISNISSSSRHLGLQTNSFPISISAMVDSRINSSGLLQIQAPASGTYTPTVSIDNSQISVMNLIFPKNSGFAIDLGINYKYSDVLKINASILNLGYIKWKVNANNLSFTGSYSFQGVNFDNYLAGNAASGNIVQSITDSILNSFNYNSTQEVYIDALPLQMFFSANYELSEKTEMKAVFHSIIYDQIIEGSLSAGLNYQLGKAIKTNVSLSYVNNAVSIGGGIVLGKKHTQFFLFTENIPLQFAKFSGTPILIPYGAKTINLQFGLSLKFACTKKKRGKNQSNTICPAYSVRKVHKKSKRKR